MTVETFVNYVLLPCLGTLAGSFLGAAIALRGILKEVRTFGGLDKHEVIGYT